MMVHYLSESYFELPKRTYKNNSNIMILFEQTLKVVKTIFGELVGFHMRYDEIKDFFKEA